MRRNSKLWIPSTGEERYLTLIALAVVILLLALGFEILKLPTLIAPGWPLLPKLLGLGALVILGLTFAWNVARDDYLRFGYGFPRVLVSFALVSLLLGAAFLMRGWLDGTFVIDPSREVSAEKLVTALIGGQFGVMAFFTTYLFKRSDPTAVRKFKKDFSAIRSFVVQTCSGALRGSAYDHAYNVVKADFAAMQETARAVQQVVEPNEAQFAASVGEASGRLHEFLAVTPTAAVNETVEHIRKRDKEILSILGGKQI